MILTDKFCTLSLYYNINNTEISSSFLAIMMANRQDIVIDKFAMIEALTTPGIIPPDTHIKQIRRWIPDDSGKILGDINVYKYKNEEIRNNEKASYTEAIESQIDRLDSYFEFTKNIFLEHGAVLGLTGGFDSRLLLAFLLRHDIAAEFYTHWQKGISKDFSIAREIADRFNISILYVKKHEIDDIDNEVNFTPGFLFTDGQIRLQYYWSEIYSSIEYYKLLNVRNRIGLNGVGGEQYRNSENCPVKGELLKHWLQREVLYKSKHIFKSLRDQDEFIDSYLSKVKQILKCDINRITPYATKKYFNQVYGYANRYYRASFENQVMHHLSPFVDPYLSLYAYRAIPFNTSLYKFQIDILNRLNPDLAKVKSRYGFPMDKDFPLYYQFLRKIQRTIPRYLSDTIKENSKNTRKVDRSKQELNHIKDIFIDVNYEKLYTKESQSILLREVNFFYAAMIKMQARGLDA